MHRAGSAGELVPGDVSSLLRAWSDGDQRALALLTPIVYEALDDAAFLCTDRSNDFVSLDEALTRGPSGRRGASGKAPRLGSIAS